MFVCLFGFFPPPVVTKLRDRIKPLQEKIDYKYYFTAMFYTGNMDREIKFEEQESLSQRKSSLFTQLAKNKELSLSLPSDSTKVNASFI